MPNEFPPRETSSLVALFQRAHNKVVALARMDDQIAAMVVQHERLQDEVRAVQNEINQEFERTLKFNQAPAKLPGTIGITPTIVPQPIPASHPPSSNGEHSKPEMTFGGEVIPLSRV